MDGYAYNENDYRIQGILRKNNITDEDVENWFQRKAKVKDVVLSVSLSVWRKSLDPRFPSSRMDAVIFAHNKNHSIAIEIQNHFQKILFQLEPKIEIFSKESWTPVDNGSMHFKTNDGKEVSASLGFLVVTPEFCTEEWGTLSGQPFFQQAMYDKDVTIVPVLVNNPRHMKERIPLGIKCLRSVDFYNKDDIISQKTLDTFLEPAIKSRVNKEKEELRYHIYWLYWNAIKVYHHYPWSYPQHKRSRMPSQDDSDYYSHSTYQSYSQQSSSPNGKGDQTTGQGFNSDSAYGSDERNSQWAESTGSAPRGDGDRASHHSNQSADDMNNLPHAPSPNVRSLSESKSTGKSHKHKTQSPLHRDIGEQRSSNHSVMSRRSVSNSFHPPPSQHEIFINSFPSDVEQTSTSNLASANTAPLSACDVTHCFRPSGDCVSAPSSGYSDSRREKMVNVGKSFSSLNHHHEDDDDDNDAEDDVIRNDLSLPDTHAEEANVEVILSTINGYWVKKHTL